jgi:hypothetical protein
MKGANLRFKATGDSMHPLIENGDVLVVEPVTPTFSVGDILLNSRPDGLVTAHRLVRIRRRNGSRVLVTKGDSLDYLDPPITPEQVLGRIISVERNGQTAKLNSRFYRVLAVCWAMLSPYSRYLRPFLRPGWRLCRNWPLISGRWLRQTESESG